MSSTPEVFRSPCRHRGSTATALAASTSTVLPLKPFSGFVGHSYGGMVVTGVANRPTTGSASSSTSTPRTRGTVGR